MNNKMLFKNHTTYSKKTYNEFVQFHNKKYGFIYDLYTISIFILFIYCLIVSFINKIFFLTIVFILSIFLFLLYRIIYPLFEYKKELSSNYVSKEQSFFFYFYEKNFKIREKSRLVKIKYYKLRKIYETDKFFYLYMTKNHAFLIDKQGFTLGNSKEFSKFMKNKLKLRYHLETKN